MEQKAEAIEAMNQILRDTGIFSRWFPRIKGEIGSPEPNNCTTWVHCSSAEGGEHGKSCVLGLCFRRTSMDDPDGINEFFVDVRSAHFSEDEVAALIALHTQHPVTHFVDTSA